MPEQPDRNRGLSAAELAQKRAAEEAARKEALDVVERWNVERSPLWSPTIRCAIAPEHRGSIDDSAQAAVARLATRTMPATNTVPDRAAYTIVTSLQKAPRFGSRLALAF